MTEFRSLDLFGDLTTLPSGRRGRPSHCWSQEAENRVILGCAMGWKPERIAAGLGISTPTLRKYYFSALKLSAMARDRYELWRAARLAEAANAGNVTASRELDRVMAKMDLARQAAKLAERQEDSAEAAAERRLGKKVLAQRAGEQSQAEGWGGDLDPNRWQH